MTIRVLRINKLMHMTFLASCEIWFIKLKIKFMHNSVPAYVYVPTCDLTHIHTLQIAKGVPGQNKSRCLLFWCFTLSQEFIICDVMVVLASL